MKQKFHKLLSIVLTLAMIFSCFTIALTTAVVAEEEIVTAVTYYVSPEGDDNADGTTTTAPLLSVDGAIKKANAAGFGAGQIVEVKLIKGFAEDGTTEVNNNWDADGGGATLTTYVYKLSISSADSTKIATLGPGQLQLGGPTEFANVVLKAGNYTNFTTKNYDVKFGKGTSISGYWQFVSGWNGDSRTDDINYLFEVSTGVNFHIGGIGNNPVYNNNVNITVDSASKASFRFGNRASKGTTTINANVNFDLKSASSFALGDGENTAANFGSDAAVQIINSTGTASRTDSAETYLSGKTTTASTEEAPEYLDYYILQNKTTAFKEELSFTATAGKFNVAEGFSAVATKVVAEDSEEAAAVVQSNDGVLDLTAAGAGEYNVEIIRNPQKVTYYVAPATALTTPGADTNTGLTPESPLPSVEAVILKANAVKEADGTTAFYDGNDVVEVKIIKAVDADGAEISNTWGKTLSNGQFTAYAYTLDISSYSDKVTMPNEGQLTLTGNTRFDNIKIVQGGNRFSFNGFSVHFGKGTEINCSEFALAWLGTPLQNIELYFGCATGSNYFNVGGAYSNKTYNNINVIVDSGKAASFRLGDRNGSSNTATYNGVITFDIKDASSFDLRSSSGIRKFGDNSAVQIINSDGVTLTSNTDTVNNYLSSVGVPKYFIINNTFPNKNALVATETAGVFKVNLSTDVYSDIKLVNAADADDIIEVKDGFVTLTNNGEYNLVATKKQNLSTTYYVGAVGSDDNDGKTEATALLTVNKAIELAKSTGYAADDTVYIKVLYADGAAASWGASSNTITAHEFLLKVSSLSTKANIGTGGLTLGGPIAFENITLNLGNSSFPAFQINGKDIHFGAGTSYNDVQFDFAFTTGYDIQFNDDINLYYGVAWKEAGFSSWGQPIINGDINATFNNNGSNSFNFTSGNRTGSQINGNVNLDIKAAASVTVKSGKVTYGENTAFQFINSAGIDISDSIATVSALKDGTMPVYVINNTYSKNMLAFTDTAGKYKVIADSTNYSNIKLVNANDETLEYSAVDGYISDVPAGTYNLVATKNTNAVGTYYVSPNGDDDNDGKTTAKPFATVNGAIKAAIADGYGASDTVNVKLIKVSGKDNAWGASTLTKHEFTLHIQSATDKTSVGDGSATTFNGPIAFTNVAINWSGNGNINYNGSNLTINENVTYPTSDFNHYFARSGAQDVDKFININGDLNKALWLGGDWGGPTYNADLYITYDKGATGTINLGTNNCDSSKHHLTYFNKNVNFNIRDAKSFTLSVRNQNSALFGDDAAVQIINSSGLDSAKWNTDLSNTANGVPSKYYIINNETGVKDAVSFTSVAGKYAIDIDTDIFELKVNGVAAEIVDGFITLTANGVHTITAEKKGALNATFFVSPDGDSANAGTEEAPFKTVEDAIVYANNKGYGEGDTVNVKVIAVEGKTNYLKGDGTSGAHLSAYDYTLNISSAGTDKVTVRVPLGGTLNGVTVFDNIGLVLGGKWSVFSINGNDVSFVNGSTVTTNTDRFTLGATNAGITYDKDVNVYFGGGSYSYGDPFSAGWYAAPTVTGDYNITVDNTGSNSIMLSTMNSGQSRVATYQKNVNIIVKNASALTLSALEGRYSFGGAIQLINSSSADISAAKEVINGLGAPAYIINNQTGNKDLIGITSTAGTYTVTDLADNETVEVYNKSGTKILDGIKDTFTVPSAGEYTVVIYRVPLNANYIANAGVTIATLVQSALDAGFIAGDTVNITCAAGETIEWGTVPAHAFTLNITSDADNKASLFVGLLGGNTNFDNIKITNSGSNPDSYFYANNHSVTFGSGVELNASFIFNFTDVGAVVENTQNVIFDCKVTGNIRLGNHSYCNETWEKDVNIIINHPDSNPEISFSTAWTNGIAKHYIKGNLNIILNDGKGVKFGTITGTGGNNDHIYKTQVDGALTVFIPGDATVTGKDNIRALNTANQYYVVDGLGTLGKVSVDQATLGKFNVEKSDPDAEVNVVDNYSNVLPVTGDSITLTPGDYRFTGIVEAKSGEYTVSADGELNSIDAAIQQANSDGYIAGDTVTVKVSGATVVPYGDNTALTTHGFKLIITTADGEDKRIVGEAGESVHFGGDVEHNNITIGISQQGHPIFGANGHDITFSNGANFSNTVLSAVMGKNSGGLSIDRDVNLNIYTPLIVDYRLGNRYTAMSFNKDVTVNIDSASYNKKIIIGNEYAEANATFNGNINFNIKSAAGFTVDKSYAIISDNTAVQIVNSTNLSITNTTGALNGLTNKSGNAVPMYIINNITGVKDAVTFTNTAGLYHVDLGEAKYEGYVAFFTNNDTGEVTTVKTAQIQLEPGTYTLNMKRDAVDYSFDVNSGTTIAQAIQDAITAGAGYGDNVTFNVLADVDIGALPVYNFNLVIKSDTNVQLNDTNAKLANNPGMTTEFRNVRINHVSNGWGSTTLGGSNVIFDKNVTFTGDAHLWIYYSSTDTPTDQTVVFNCPTPEYIGLSGASGTGVSHSHKLNLVINHKDAAPKIRFNSYYSNHSRETHFYDDVNINIKDAASFTIDGNILESYSKVRFDENAHLTFIIDGNTSFDYTTLTEVLNGFEVIDPANVLLVVDKTFQRRSVDLTDTWGTFAVNNPYDVTVTNTKWFNDGFVVPTDEYLKTAQVENGMLSVDLNDNFAHVWELTSNEYHEDFNDKTLEDLKADWYWKDKTGKPNYLENGKFVFYSWNEAKEGSAVITNNHLNSKEQFISVDVEVKNIDASSGLSIIGRLTNDYKGYELQVTSDRVNIRKITGAKNTSGFYTYETTGFEENGLMEFRPTPDSGDKNTISFNGTHTYRVGLSVTTDYDKNGAEVALVRCIVLDITANTLIFDETFRDTQPITGTKFGIYSPNWDKINTLYLDNFYYSTESFQETDDGWYDKDINGDGIYDIRDLVLTNEELKADTVSQNMLYKADRNANGGLDDTDLNDIRKEILLNIALEKNTEFDYVGYTDTEADKMRENILNSTSNLVFETPEEGAPTIEYTTSATVMENGVSTQYSAQYDMNGSTNGVGYSNAMFVSADGSGDGSGSSADNSMSFVNFIQALKNKEVYTGTLVAFKRGDTFRLDTKDLMNDSTVVNNPSANSYAYMIMPEGTLFGAYGTGAKPRFTSSQKEYATEVTWTEVGGKNSNIWVIDAPEFDLDSSDSFRDGIAENKDNAPTNVIFNGGEKVGLRKGFPVGLNPENEKLYTLYKEGDFTYDADTGKFYLYSVGNPSEKYDSIEISRSITGINVNGNGFVIDNLNLSGFGKFAVHGSYGDNNLTITNCEIGFAGGAKMANSAGDVGRYGNAIETWCGGSDYHVKYNWIYQTWDSAITTQANNTVSHDNMRIIGNLLEYNNADLEFFDSDKTTDNATRRDTKWTDNVMRFTSLGWGSRSVSKIRNIQAVIRGGLSDASVVQIDWTHNTIDSPGMEIMRFNNLTLFEDSVDADGNYTSGDYIGMFKFGQTYVKEGLTNPGESKLGANKYYLNPYVRSTNLILWEYRTMLPSEYNEKYPVLDENGNQVTDEDGNPVVAKENTYHTAKTAQEFYDKMQIVEDPTLTTADIGLSEFYFLGEKVTSGN